MNQTTYPKIDIYVRGKYICSTNKSASLAEAKLRFLAWPVYQGADGLTRVENLSVHQITVKWSKP